VVPIRYLISTNNFKIRKYINGELIAPISGNYLDNINPAIGKVYSYIPDSDAKDVELATQAALAAFPSWSKTPKEKRSRIIQKIAFLIEENRDYILLATSRSTTSSSDAPETEIQYGHLQKIPTTWIRNRKIIKP